MHPSRLSSLHTRSRGYLPHWEIDNSYYFITYRLADSLLRDVTLALRDEHARLRRVIARGRRPTLQEHAEIGRAFAMALDRHLDAAHGSCQLRKNEIASVVAENLHHFDGTRYTLDAWCVMPNHVHVVVFLYRGRDLPGVVHSWKSCTSKIAIRLAGIQPPFWQAEYFDRIIRDVDDLETTRQYVRENAVKAGLGNWKWVGSPRASGPRTGGRGRPHSVQSHTSKLAVRSLGKAKPPSLRMCHACANMCSACPR